MKKIKEFFSGLNTKLRLATGKLKIYKNVKWLYLVPAIVLFVALLEGTIFQLSGTRGFANIGVDFQGGTRMTIDMAGAVLDTDENRDIIKKIIEDKGFAVTEEPQTSGENSLIYRYSNKLNSNNNLQEEDLGQNGKKLSDLNNAMSDEIKEKLGKDNVEVIVNTTQVGSETSKRLLKSGLIATAVALAVMLVYIVIRFDLYSAIAAILMLMHDVLMMLSFTVMFRVEINSTIVAGVITIVAYSLNNTIVVFDRIREKVKPLKKQNKRVDVTDIIDPSIHETMTRTIYTTLTTLITIALLAILGVNAVQIFALPIIFGLLAGFYSSVFLAAPLWGILVELKDRIKNKSTKSKVSFITRKHKA